jgi:hypothetical protein
VDVDLKKDLCHIRYHEERVTLEQMLETIQAQGFRGERVEPTAPDQGKG